MEYVNCSLCSDDDYQLLFKKENFKVVRCNKCGLIYINPRPTKDELVIAVSGDFYRQHFIPPAFDAHDNYRTHKTLLRELKNYSRINRLLDVGCASGLFLAAAKEEGWEVKGVDISEPAVSYGRDKLGLDIFLGDLEEASYPDEHFDVIICRDTIEHIQNPYGLLKEANRILRNEGLIFISTPNFNSLTRLFLKEKWSIIIPGHLYYFSRKTAEQMLKKSGFEVKKILTINIEPYEILLGGILGKDIQKNKTREASTDLVTGVQSNILPTHFERKNTQQNKLIEVSTNSVIRIQSNKLLTHFKRWANLVLNLLKIGDKLVIYAEKSASAIKARSTNSKI